MKLSLWMKPLSMVVLSCAVLLVGCATPDYPLQARSGSAPEEFRARVFRNVDPVEQPSIHAQQIELLQELTDSAVLSRLAYRYDLATPDERRNSGCTSYPGEHSSQALPSTSWIPLTEEALQRLGISPTGGTPLRPCESKKGLGYQAFVRIVNGNPQELVIAYRGTENDEAQRYEDWKANLSGLAGLLMPLNRDYEQAAVSAQALIAAVAPHLPQIEPSPTCQASGDGARPPRQLPVYLTGHSLGGGLAQHVAYRTSACDVRRTVTFDPSPVTNWVQMKRACLLGPDSQCVLRNPDPEIWRAFLDGEALSYVRAFTTAFNAPRTQRMDIELHFPGVKGTLVERHSMKQLSACIQLWSGRAGDVLVAECKAQPAPGASDRPVAAIAN